MAVLQTVAAASVVEISGPVASEHDTHLLWRALPSLPSPESPTRSPVLARVFERRGNFWEGEREREGGEIFLGQVYKTGATLLTQPALPRWTAMCA